MHWRELLDVTQEYGKFVDGQMLDTAYDEAIQALEWNLDDAAIESNIEVFTTFLGKWKSLRRPLDRERLRTVWMTDVEPYARGLEGKSIETLDTQTVVDAGAERVRVGVAIEHMYGSMCTVEGVGETNSSKLLHLRLPNVFVMTDASVRQEFIDVMNRMGDIKGSSLFEPYGYAFHFLPYVRAQLAEAIASLQFEEKIPRADAMKRLRRAHGRTRSLAKLADEYYYMRWGGPSRRGTRPC